MAHLEEVESLPIRRPIALYYSSSEEHLQQDLQGSYLNPSFGPMANSSPADFALLCSRSAASSKRAQRPSIALIVPHGAYCDAGPVTAHAYFELAKSELAFDSVVVIGTNHRGEGQPIALSRSIWQIPMGTGMLMPDLTLINELTQEGIPVDESAHVNEHSIENQLPFLQQLYPGIKLVPISVASINLEVVERVGLAISRVLLRSGRAGSILLVGTTDFTHAGVGYGELPSTDTSLLDYVRNQDRPVLQAIESGRPGLVVKEAARTKSSICGLWSLTLTLQIAAYLNLKRCSLLRYAVSSEVLWRDDMCGFASFILTQDEIREGSERDI